MTSYSLAVYSVLTAVVFDFDELLMDTESTLLASWEFEWQQWGLTLDRESFFVGHGGDVTADRYADLGRAVGPRFDRDVSDARRVAYRELLHDRLKLAEGIEDWISCAHELKLRLAVASSSPRPWVERHLRQVDALDSFDVIACGDEVDEHKPAPDVYRLALRRLGTAVDGCVAVGTHRTGLTPLMRPGWLALPYRTRSYRQRAGHMQKSCLKRHVARC